MFVNPTKTKMWKIKKIENDAKISVTFLVSSISFPHL